MIVIGCGGLGSAALYWLARRLSDQVLGLEQFALGHDFGGSQDHSRIIRLAQHQFAYAALAPDAYRTWYDVEQASSQQLVFQTGGLVIEAPSERDPEKVGNRNIEGYMRRAPTPSTSRWRGPTARRSGSTPGLAAYTLEVMAWS